MVPVRAGRKILVQPNGRGVSPPIFFGDFSMSELSIFVDESGDFGRYAKHSPYYDVTMVFHDQSIDLSTQIMLLNNNLMNLGYESISIHTEPLIQREEAYKNLNPNERRALLTKLYYFVLHSDISYKSFLYEKIHFADEMKLQARMAKDISLFLRDHLSYFSIFDKIIVYYDNGQKEITRILNAVLATELSNVELRKVHPENYRLLQAADLICTLALLQRRYDENRLTRSDMLIFHSRNDLRKDFLKHIKDKEFSISGSSGAP